MAYAPRPCYDASIVARQRPAIAGTKQGSAAKKIWRHRKRPAKAGTKKGSATTQALSHRNARLRRDETGSHPFPRSYCFAGGSTAAPYPPAKVPLCSSLRLLSPPTAPPIKNRRSWEKKAALLRFIRADCPLIACEPLRPPLFYTE